MQVITLKKGRDKSVLRKHPWVFSGSIARISGTVENGSLVLLQSEEGRKLAIGSYSVGSQIAVRVWSFNTEELINDDFFRKRIVKALKYREHALNLAKTTAYRIINAESDGLPGVIADRYENAIICQFLSAGAEYFKDRIVSMLVEILKPDLIYERSEGDSRLKEGLEERYGTLHGALPDGLLTIEENGIKYQTDIVKGHKTGFYLDQRDNRQILHEISYEKDVLNCFSYTGGFGLSALAAGARKVTNIDVSASAMDQLVQNVRANNFDESRIENINGDVFHYLRKMRDSGTSYDIIILDPPKFASSASQVPGAARGYKDINLLAMKLLKPGGMLMTFSCSAHIVPEFFRKIITDAAIDAGCNVYIERNLQQASDHPFLISFAESLYLKGFLCRVLKD